MMIRSFNIWIWNLDSFLAPYIDDPKNPYFFESWMKKALMETLQISL